MAQDNFHMMGSHSSATMAAQGLVLQHLAPAAMQGPSPSHVAAATAAQSLPAAARFMLPGAPVTTPPVSEDEEDEVPFWESPDFGLCAPKPEARPAPPPKKRRRKAPQTQAQQPAAAAAAAAAASPSATVLPQPAPQVATSTLSTADSRAPLQELTAPQSNGQVVATSPQFPGMAAVQAFTEASQATTPATSSQPLPVPAQPLSASPMATVPMPATPMVQTPTPAPIQAPPGIVSPREVSRKGPARKSKTRKDLSPEELAAEISPGTKRWAARRDGKGLKHYTNTGVAESDKRRALAIAANGWAKKSYSWMRSQKEQDAEQAHQNMLRAEQDRQRAEAGEPPRKRNKTKHNIDEDEDVSDVVSGDSGRGAGDSMGHPTPPHTPLITPLEAASPTSDEGQQHEHSDSSLWLEEDEEDAVPAEFVPCAGSSDNNGSELLIEESPATLGSAPAAITAASNTPSAEQQLSEQDTDSESDDTDLSPPSPTTEQSADTQPSSNDEGQDWSGLDDEFYALFNDDQPMPDADVEEERHIDGVSSAKLWDPEEEWSEEE
ncbi:hypothetical protein Micbo1qcDRAFT_212063 [Microdochium bolleyi]|uniref:Uncharacterized protein n=1 Tax=Microdochium bolleyi TaxID=196109 RepID=A0A136IY26_9PEZI|nr:hypothetical protein Micbo1qcDRAFT_212063 [Microdochium bolleyi]